ncbi:MAG TPA: exosortase/archaeosortase family protein [Tepidisphaeraceae bacterium]|jgi:exosortase
MTVLSRPKITPSLAVLAFVLALFGVAVTHRAWADIARIGWELPEYQHVFLVPFVAAFLCYVRRERLNYLRLSGTALGPTLVIIGWVAGSYGYNYRVQALFHVGAVLVLIGCLTAALGKQVLFRFMPAAVVMLLIVPIPGDVRRQISQPLQQYTAQIASYLLGLIGVLTEVRGSVIVINDQPVAVAEACNGMRMVFPLLLISYGFAYGLPLRVGVRILIVLLSPLVALACNVLRVLPLVWLQGQGQAGQSWGERLHEQSGWVMVPLAFLVLLGLIRLLRWGMVPVYRYPLASQGH